MGAQGVGKTTLLDALSRLYSNLKPMPSIQRELASRGFVRLNEDGDEESQRLLFDANLYSIVCNDNIITARSPIDVLAYTKDLYFNGDLRSRELAYQLKMTKQWLSSLRQDDILLYIPIEFEPKADGVRSIDPVYQECIDKRIKNRLDEFGCAYTEVKGEFQERLDTAILAIEAARNSAK